MQKLLVLSLFVEVDVNFNENTIDVNFRCQFPICYIFYQKSCQYIPRNQSKINLKKNFKNFINSKNVYYIAKLHVFEVTNPAPATNQYLKAECVAYNSK